MGNGIFFVYSGGVLFRGKSAIRSEEDFAEPKGSVGGDAEGGAGFVRFFQAGLQSAFAVGFPGESGRQVCPAHVAEQGAAALRHDQSFPIDVGAAGDLTGPPARDFLPQGKGLPQAGGGHLHLFNGAVLPEGDSFRTHPAVILGVSGAAVVENIPLPPEALDAAMDIP